MALVPKSLFRITNPSSHWAERYAIACFIVMAATLLRAAADPLIHNQIPYFIYVASVVVTTWFCGFDAGVLGTVAAAFLGNYFFVPPRYDFIPHGEDWNAMTMFSVVALGLVSIVSRWRQAEQDLRRQADDLRLLHSEAERISRLKDEFLATLSHELRTPLNAVLGWAQILNAGKLDSRQQQRAAETILRNAKAQARLVEDILDVSAIVSGKLKLRLAKVDVATVVQSAIDVIRSAVDAKAIEVRTAYVPDAYMVGDPDRLRQVAWNLLSNAVKFSDKGGVVDVRIGRQNSQLLLQVADTGSGIDPEFAPHLFERFRQADSSTTRRHGGLGLGLAVVRHLVELHGGTVGAASAGVGRGATFTVTFPVHAVTTEAQAAGVGRVDATDDTSRPRVSLHGIRVVVVDDESDARELVAVILREYGADVRAAQSAQDAYREIRRWRPDVLVADIGMPDEDGYSLLRRVRALSPDQGGAIAAAALTAYAQAEDRDRAFRVGFQAHIAKPVMAHQLAELVASLAGMKGVRPN